MAECSECGDHKMKSCVCSTCLDAGEGWGDEELKEAIEVIEFYSSPYVNISTNMLGDNGKRARDFIAKQNKGGK